MEAALRGDDLEEMAVEGRLEVDVVGARPILDINILSVCKKREKEKIL